jgi:alkylhydroperoxidase family enzyme
MRIPPWNPETAPRDPALVDAILERRGGKLIELDRALLWSEPLARAWNVYLRAIRQEVSISPRLREIAICMVAKSTGADYEFKSHWPQYVKAGGNDALRPKLDHPRAASEDAAFAEDERLAMRYALAMTESVRVPDALFGEIRKRFSETEVVELTAAIATYNMVARFLVALEI